MKHSITTDEATALAAIKGGSPIVIILGRAGTGKTTLIRTLLEQDSGNQVVLAPTGVAAVNVGGQTIHSFFRIPPQLHNLSEIKPRSDKKLFKKLRRVIIDEISMVRADLMDAIDHALQVNRKNSQPFGGVQMVLVGDFFQLPPVVRADEREMLAHRGYAKTDALSANCLCDNESITLVELSKVHRQDNPEFIRLLGNLRDKNDLEATVKAFNNSCLGDHKRDAAPVMLVGTNAIADRYNAEGLQKLLEKPVSYTGIISGDFRLKGDKLPVPEHLTLKIGARIMTVKNDPNKRWVNGSLGTVKRMEKDRIWIELDGKKGKQFEIERTNWGSVQYEWDGKTQSIQTKIMGSYSQIPVIPAWALTIHKAQGLTLENVRVDLGSGAFAAGQAYVALSRARSLDGLSFVRSLRVSDIIVRP